MSDPLLQIYSATYSNVPVFEFVTSEGPIMRRKSDSWINATHILKVAKFPKARRTRILEKDVQVGIHDKVQGGYGKYQGTYVPLELGKEIATRFEVYDVLRPIFDFVFVEGTSETPPPAPKHNHALASNIARRQLQQQQQQKHKQDLQTGLGAESDHQPPAKRVKTDDEHVNGGPLNDYPNTQNSTNNARKSAKEKSRCVGLPPRRKPPAVHTNKTVPITPDARNSAASGPSIGVFSSSASFTGNVPPRLPPLLRQDTEWDAVLVMASNMHVRAADLEADQSDLEVPLKRARNDPFSLRGSDGGDDEFMSRKELFGSHAFGLSQCKSPESAARLLSLNGSIRGSINGNVGAKAGENAGGDSIETGGESPDDTEAAEYFNTLLNYLMEDGGQTSTQSTFELPESVLSLPQPLHKINIARPVDDDGNTIFHWACSMANIGMIKFLLSIFSNCINSEVTNFQGETPLMFLVQFRNSYQLHNFPMILDILFDSMLSVDKLGRTVLHHIALACDISRFDNVLHSDSDAGSKARKERFTNYYFDVVFSKIVGFPDYQLLRGDERRSLEDKKEVISKFINHRDNNGNTAFHVVAYNMSKKCIKTFIRYHNFIDLSLKNHVNYTVEDYLVSHNYVLRLENEDGSAPSNAGGSANGVENGDLTSQALMPLEYMQSFDTQMQATRMALHAHHTCMNSVTERLGELSYAVEKELREKDHRLHALHRFLRVVGLEKFRAQKAVLQLFDLHHLVADIARDYGFSETDTDEKEDDKEDSRLELLAMAATKSRVIQEEISRLMNDLAFQKITVEEQLCRALARYKHVRELKIALELNVLVKVREGDLLKGLPTESAEDSVEGLLKSLPHDSAEDLLKELPEESLEELLKDFRDSLKDVPEDSKDLLTHSLTDIFKNSQKDSEESPKDLPKHSPKIETITERRCQLAVSLQRQIVRRRKLADALYEQESKVPLCAAQRDEYKENAGASRTDDNSGTAPEEETSLVPSKMDVPAFTISDYPPTDKLYKYCKLVALSCGMSMSEVKSNIDLLELSLAKAANGN